MESRVVFKQVSKALIIFLAILFVQNSSMAIIDTGSDQGAPSLRPPIQADSQSSQSSSNDSYSQPQQSSYSAPAASYSTTSYSTNSYASNSANSSNAKANTTASSENATPTRSISIPTDGFKFFGPQNQEETQDQTADEEQPLEAPVPGKFALTVGGKTYDIGKHFNIATIMTILGVIGTFFGLFSSWLIYHLNKKNSNPLIIDKNNAAIEYIDRLNRIKTYFANNSIKNIKRCLENFDGYQPEEVALNIQSYEDICKGVSRVDLLGIHTRYKKHIDKYNLGIYNSLIASYKIVKIDGDYFNSTEEGCHLFDPSSLKNFVNMSSFKSKILSLLTFEEQVDVVIEVLQRELK